MSWLATLAVIWLCLGLVVIIVGWIIIKLMPKISPRWWQHIVVDDDPQNIEENASLYPNPDLPKPKK